MFVREGAVNVLGGAMVVLTGADADSEGTTFGRLGVGKISMFF